MLLDSRECVVRTNSTNEQHRDVNFLVAHISIIIITSILHSHLKISWRHFLFLFFFFSFFPPSPFFPFFSLFPFPLVASLDSFNGGEPRRRVEQSWTVPDFFVQSRSGRPLVELKLSLESFWVRSKWPAGDVSFKRFSKFRKSESHGLHACMDRGKDSLFQRSINRKRTRISLLGARSCPALHSP